MSAAPSRLRHRVGETIVGRALWKTGDRVLVAVSGGLDSVALLDLLVETAGWHGGRLEVATVDHGTRPGAAEDADFVEALATGLGLPFHRIALGLGAEADEDRCRTERYRALEAVPADVIAVAHHRDDQAETVLVQLARGSGTRGLAGMGYRRGRVVRPLLEVSRDELRAWAEHRGLSWREDPSNLSPRFLRNRIRREVLPLLESIRPGAAASLARSATAAAIDADLIEAIVAADPEARPGSDGWRVEWLLGVHEAVARRALLDAMPGATYAHVEAALAVARRGSGSVRLAGGHRFVVAAGRARVDLNGPGTGVSEEDPGTARKE